MNGKNDGENYWNEWENTLSSHFMYARSQIDTCHVGNYIVPTWWYIPQL
jgi:hypothetical protein